jgi:hypothetical protein
MSENGKLFPYKDSISFPPLKWHSFSDSSVTGMNLLCAFVVPEDLENHFI